MRRLLSLAPLFVAIALPFLDVQACGPDFFPDVFVHTLHADHPADYAAGKLGVLLPTYPRADLTVAYRYLNGGQLTIEEQRAYHPTLSLAEQVREDDAADASQAQAAATNPQYAEPPGPADQWLKARARYAPLQPNLHPVTEYDSIYSSGYFLSANYENCQVDAFRTAITTLSSRAKTWGPKSVELADWINGQDAVFSNCGDGVETRYYPDKRPVIQASIPADTPANSPILLKQDRAYQIAATQFYTRQLAARASFQAIAQDETSPWRGVARYLVARVLIREAFLGAKNGPDEVMASFDPDLMEQAQQELESMRKENLPGVPPHAVQSMLNLVRIRTEPQVRLREMSSALAGPKTDPYYQQDLGDLNWYLNGKLDGSLAIREDADDVDFNIEKPKGDYTPLTFEQKLPGFEKAYHGVVDLRSISPLIDWLVTFQSPSEAAKMHALAEWKRTGGTPWLAAAIMKTSSSNSSISELLDAASRIPKTSPAWLTVTYHRERLLIETGKAQQAATEIDADMSAIQQAGSDSAVNLFTGLRMRSASTLDIALANSPRKILERTSEESASVGECLYVMKDPKRKYDCKKVTSPREFSGDAAAIFNDEMPLVTLAQSANSSTLPPQLRQSVAIMAWVRSVLLKNEMVAAQMLPLLPVKLQQQAGAGVGFRPLMAILRNPGLRPYLDGGVQRSASYDFVESYSDNWWCGNWSNGFGGYQAPAGARSIAFLSGQDLDTGKKETTALLSLGSADEYLGSQVLDYAKAHPADPDIPEALYLTLRAIRYGCYHGWGTYTGSNIYSDPDANKQHANSVASIAQEVGAIMRTRYPSNPWTRKATPYVWPVKKND